MSTNRWPFSLDLKVSTQFYTVAPRPLATSAYYRIIYRILFCLFVINLETIAAYEWLRMVVNLGGQPVLTRDTLFYKEDNTASLQFERFVIVRQEWYMVCPVQRPSVFQQPGLESVFGYLSLVPWTYASFSIVVCKISVTFTSASVERYNE